MRSRRRARRTAGAHVVAGSDWSVAPSVNPWLGMEELVTRESPGGSKETFGKDEAITVPQAFQLFTVNAAQYEGMASRVGMHRAGNAGRRHRRRPQHFQNTCRAEMVYRDGSFS